MEIRTLNTFIHVAKMNSFSEAADYLGYSQSTISSHIQQLESEFDCKLFERNGKLIHLSSKGEELLPYAIAIVEQSSEAMHAMTQSENPSGPLKIDVIETTCNYVLPPVLEAYMRQYPNVQITVRTATTLEIMERLRQNKTDLILTLDEKIKNPDMVTAWSMSDDIQFFCSREHSFAEKKQIRLADLLEEKLLLTEIGCNYRYIFEQDLQKKNMWVKNYVELSSTQNIIDLVDHNMGVSFLPGITLKKALEDSRLSLFDLQDYRMTMEIQLIYRKGKWISPAIKKFIDMTRDVYRSKSHP